MLWHILNVTHNSIKFFLGIFLSTIIIYQIHVCGVSIQKYHFLFFVL